MLDFSVTFIITIINIVVLCLILRVILFKPVTKFMADRAKRVQDAIDQAGKEKTEAEKMRNRYQDMLNNANAEAGKIVKAAQERAAAEADRIIAEGKAEAQAIKAAAQSQIESERQSALIRFKAEAVALVMAACARLVQRELSGDNRHYAELLLNELAAQKRNQGL
jgi:F-type H+-transporting ATPase subunit b